MNTAKLCLFAQAVGYNTSYIPTVEVSLRSPAASDVTPGASRPHYVTRPLYIAQLSPPRQRRATPTHRESADLHTGKVSPDARACVCDSYPALPLSLSMPETPIMVSPRPAGHRCRYRDEVRGHACVPTADLCANTPSVTQTFVWAYSDDRMLTRTVQKYIQSCLCGPSWQSRKPNNPQEFVRLSRL